MRIRLSYDLSNSTLVPSGLPPVRLEQFRSIERGDVSNLFLAEFCNHSGTHLDAPWHFNRNGKRITDLPIDFFFFERPLLIDVPMQPSQLVTAGDLVKHGARLAGCDLLLLRTGFGRLRDRDPRCYQLRNPGLSRSVAEYLHGGFPEIRGIALDTISVAANESLEEGLDAHRILFSDVDRPRILIEDINLDFDLSGLRRISVLPLFIDGADGAPCTITAELE